MSSTAVLGFASFASYNHSSGCLSPHGPDTTEQHASRPLLKNCLGILDAPLTSTYLLVIEVRTCWSDPEWSLMHVQSVLFNFSPSHVLLFHPLQEILSQSA